MKTEKLSFDAFKHMAEGIQSKDVLEQIEGGSWSDCHGFWGALGKAFRKNAEDNPGSIGFEFESN